jgi:spectinomycin phosphotransferase
LSPGDRYGRLALRDLLLPRQGNILGMLDHLHALAEPLRQMPPPFVICHTDIHTGNVLRNREGSLIVLDWEGVCLAPAEYDLFIFTGEGFEAFLQAYYHMGGGRNLTASTFAYYLYRRNLEDLADFIVRILDENTDLQTDQSDLEGVNALLADWPGLEKAEQRLRLILSEV